MKGEKSKIEFLCKKKKEKLFIFKKSVIEWPLNEIVSVNLNWNKFIYDLIPNSPIQFSDSYKRGVSPKKKILYILYTPLPLNGRWMIWVVLNSFFFLKGAYLFFSTSSTTDFNGVKTEKRNLQPEY